ncbi:MAG: 3-deoxy-D-manno-octulosonic acid transferase [Candidatus Omnitrophota bacterium]
MILYDILFIIFSIFAFPFLLFKGKLHRGYLERLGFIDKGKICESSIWLHAVSVGEVLSSKELIRLLKVKFPDKRIVITTITQTGNKVAKDIAGEDTIVSYLPLDVSFIIKNFIKRFNPYIFIGLETEIWPNLIFELERQSIPKVILNGRISNSSFKKYNFFRLLLKPILRKVDYFAMQSDEYAARIINLGAPIEKIEVSGNMKFDAQATDEDASDPQVTRTKLHLKPGEDLFVAGCTHQGEEEIILSVYRNLSSLSHDLRLLIAPRHVERVSVIENLIREQGFRALRISQLGGQAIGRGDIYLLDTIGSLKTYYAVCSLAFVGGSLVAAGGHNILEPAYFAKPIIFGKHMDNFSDIKDLFLKNKAAIEVEDAIELQDKIIEILKDSSMAKNLSIKAAQLVNSNMGTTKRNIAILNKVLGAYGKLSL